MTIDRHFRVEALEHYRLNRGSTYLPKSQWDIRGSILLAAVLGFCVVAGAYIYIQLPKRATVKIMCESSSIAILDPAEAARGFTFISSSNAILAVAKRTVSDDHIGRLTGMNPICAKRIHNQWFTVHAIVEKTWDRQ